MIGKAPADPSPLSGTWFGLSKPILLPTLTHGHLGSGTRDSKSVTISRDPKNGYIARRIKDVELRHGRGLTMAMTPPARVEEYRLSPFGGGLLSV
ncbi:hypothetical protein ZHAS_00015641 [Anopheles sinensis]|uniref:Uncharacterized protein n=1 Tax=Anopheles sinensis TaxID=74873 RepID=A0A084WB00_ANOSI|nr:hypothetical protein ZHAS_00015641 [Anopheles sinensis]